MGKKKQEKEESTVQSEAQKLNDDKKEKGYLFVALKKYGGRIAQNAIIITLLLLFIDEKNYPGQLKNYIGDKLFWISCALIFLQLLSYLYNKNFMDLRKMKAVCEIELFSFSILLGVTCYSLCMQVFFDTYQFEKLIVSTIAALSMFIVIIIRWIGYNKTLKHSIKRSSNIIDLKDLIELNVEDLRKKYNLSGDDKILVDEREVDYDLLKRDYIVNCLVDTIKRCSPQKHFVIGLEGDWGSGKSTILKNVKRYLENERNDSHESILIVDDFEIWRYGSEESIVRGFFECLLQGMGIRYNSIETERNLQVLIDAVVRSPEKSNILKNILFPVKSISNIKKEINEFIRLSGKKIVVYIDNLDRISSDKIVFVLKMIANIVNFDGVTYIVAYEKDKLEKALEEEINVDSEYLKKVIQLQISVPEMDFAVAENVIRKSIDKLFEYYSIKIEDSHSSLMTQDEYGIILEGIASTTKDLRDFKRTINSVFSRVISNSSFLLLKDRILLYYIRMNNIQLYQGIKGNRKFFVIENTRKYRNNDSTFLSNLNAEEEKRDRENYFEKFFAKYGEMDYCFIVKSMFPNIRDFLDKGQEGYFYPEVSGKSGIADGEFFDLYFTEIENADSLIGKDVRNFLVDFSDSQAEVEFKKLMDKYQTADEQAVVFNFFHLFARANKIPSNKLYDLLEILFENYWNVDNSIGLTQTNAHKRVEIIISELIAQIDVEDFKGFITKKSLQDWIRNLGILIRSFPRTKLLVKDNNFRNYEAKKEIWIQAVEGVLADILLNKKINIYSDLVYREKITHELFYIFDIHCFLKREGNSLNDIDFKSLRDYLCEAFDTNEEYAFKFLWDLLSCEIDDKGYHYYIPFVNFSEDYMNMFDEIGQTLNNIQPKNKDERILLELWDSYKSNSIDEDGNFNGIVLEEEWIPEFARVKNEDSYDKA